MLTQDYSRCLGGPGLRNPTTSLQEVCILSPNQLDPAQDAVSND